jgi:hypothetical protein
MNTGHIKNLLLPFYFGSVDNQERILVERELLTDPEILVDYLDLKRNIESAEAIPQNPSHSLWLKLRSKLEPRKKTLLSISFAAAIAASLFIGWIFISKPKPQLSAPINGNAVLFDSSRELPVSSNVL